MNQELKIKVNEAIKCSFVGSYIFTNEELSCLYDEVGGIIKSVAYEWGETISTLYYNEIFVALVNLAKEWAPEEDSFFEYVYRRLLGSNEGNAKTYNQIVDVIQHLYKTNQIFLFKTFKKKYYTTLCSHAFAPISSTNAFLDICWEIYCEDLNQQYIKNDSTFESIAESLRNKFSVIKNDDDDFQIGSKSYSLRAGIIGLALDEKERLIQLLDVAISTIHSLFNNEIITYDDYFKIIVKNWWTSKELEFGISTTNRLSNREIIVRDYSQIKPKYIMTEESVKLIIPPFRLNGNFDFEPYLEIKLDGKSIKYEPLSLKGSGILMATRLQEIDITEFPSLNIEITITHCDKIIYNSKNSLVREFILFNASGKEITSTECIPNCYFLYINKFNNLLQYPNDLERINIPNTFSINASDGDIIQTRGKEVFFLNEKSNKEVSFCANKLGNVNYRTNNEDYCVIDGELYVEILNNELAKNYGVKYEDAIFKLVDFDSMVVNDRTRYCISSLLMPGDTQHISLFKYSDNTILESINLIKFNNIKIHFEKDFYYGTPKATFVEFKTDKYYKKQGFISGDDEVLIPINNGHIVVYPPMLKWRIDNGPWNRCRKENPLWYEDITNSSILHIEAPIDKKIEACINNNYIDRQNNKLEFKLGEIIYSKKNYSNIEDFLVSVKINWKGFCELFRIYIKEKFLVLPYSFDSQLQKITWQPDSYIGNQNDRFKIILRDNYNNEFKYEAGLEKKVVDLDEIPDGHYNLSINLVQKSFFAKEKVLFDEKIFVGDEENKKYSNKTLKVISAVLVNPFEREKRINPVYIETLKFLGRKNGTSYYSGILFLKNNEGQKIYLDYMKEDDGTHVKINPIRFEHKGISSCYLGYGLEINDKNHFKCKGEFTFNDGFVTIGKFRNGKKNKTIEFFRYEVTDV